MDQLPIQQAMLAIQQAKLAIQQGMKFVDPDQFNRVEKQLLQAQVTINKTKQKVSTNEEQLLEQASRTIETTLQDLHQHVHPSNLQQG